MLVFLGDKTGRTGYSKLKNEIKNNNTVIENVLGFSINQHTTYVISKIKCGLNVFL